MHVKALAALILVGNNVKKSVVPISHVYNLVQSVLIIKVCNF